MTTRLPLPAAPAARPAPWSALACAPIAAALALALAPAGCGQGGGGGGGGSTSASASAGGGATSGGTTTSPTGGGAPMPSQPPAGQWLKGDLHVHTEYSEDTGRFGNDVRALVGLAEYAGLDFVVLGDHRQTRILQDPNLQMATPVTVIPGMEWGGGGHAGAHGLIRQPPFVTQTGPTGQAKLQSVDDAIADVHQQGGFFVLNHPCDPKNLWGYPSQGMDGIELWNGLWALRAAADATARDVSRWEADHGIPAAPQLHSAVQHQGGGRNFQALKMWEAYLDQGIHMAAVGGGDHHYLVLPGMPTTLVYAADRSQAAIIDGVRRGRTMVARGTDAPIVEFSADGDRDGVHESLIGDSIPLGRTVDFRIRVIDALGGKVNVVRNGQVIANFPVTQFDETFTFTDTPNARSWYRLDVYEPLDMSFPQASNLKLMVMGLQGQGWVSTLTSFGGFLSGFSGWLGNIVGQVQDVVETGAPAAAWLLIFGQQMGVRFAPTPTRYPIVEWPEHVSRVLNVDLLDDDYSRGVVTSPIWVE